MQGTVECAEGTTETIRIEVEQDGTELENSGIWSHQWTDLSHYRITMQSGDGRTLSTELPYFHRPRLQITLERDEAAQAKATRSSKKKRAEAVPVPTTSPATKSATPGGEERGLSAEGQATLEELYTRLVKADDTALVATLDRAGSEPLLRQLASPSVPLSLRVEAVRALCGAQSDETVKVLLLAFDEPAGSVSKKFVGYDSPLRRTAAAALVATGRQDVFAAILSRLTQWSCKIKAGSTGQHIAPQTKRYEKHDYIEGITYVLGHAKYRPAWDRLAEVVRTSPLLSLRLLAKRSPKKLARSSSPM